MHAVIRNDGATSCTVSSLTFYEEIDPLWPDVHVTVTNNVPALGVIAANGGTFEWDIEVQADADTDARWGKAIRFFSDSNDFYCSTRQWACVIPAAESTWSTSAPPPATGGAPLGDGWSTSANKATIHMWGGQLEPLTADFTGRHIRENDELGPGVDQCWFSGSMYLPATLSGGDWVVYANSYYAIDHVGWYEPPVNYYRTELQSPCDATVPQRMGMKCFNYDPDNDPTFIGEPYFAPFQDQDLSYGNETTCDPPALLLTNVTSQRDTQCTEKLYP